jgi:hypothetical protein
VLLRLPRADGVNNRANFESGASSLVHEVMHHLGMQHTFADGSCTDDDLSVGVCEPRARAHRTAGQPAQPGRCMPAAQGHAHGNRAPATAGFGSESRPLPADPPAADTPVTNGPVWSQPWAQRAVINCQNAWTRTLSANWDTANRAASVRVGIPVDDQNPSFNSCPNNAGSDETANYITYTYDVCLVALGHLTSGQIAAMHQITADSNPALYAW